MQPAAASRASAAPNVRVVSHAPSSSLVTLQHPKQIPPESAVVVPMVNNATIQMVLEINKHLINILVEYQNNGWIGEPEYKIETPDLSPVEYPAKLAHMRPQPKSDASAGASQQTPPRATPKAKSGGESAVYHVTEKEIKALPHSREAILDELAPTVIVMDPNAGKSRPDSKAESRPDGLGYTPVPPFVGATSAVLANPSVQLPGFNVLDEASSREIMKQRIAQHDTLLGNKRQAVVDAGSGRRGNVAPRAAAIAAASAMLAHSQVAPSPAGVAEMPLPPPVPIAAAPASTASPHRATPTTLAPAASADPLEAALMESLVPGAGSSSIAGAAATLQAAFGAQDAALAIQSQLSAIAGGVQMLGMLPGMGGRGVHDMLADASVLEALGSAIAPAMQAASPAQTAAPRVLTDSTEPLKGIPQPTGVAVALQAPQSLGEAAQPLTVPAVASLPAMEPTEEPLPAEDGGVLLDDEDDDEDYVPGPEDVEDAEDDADEGEDAEDDNDGDEDGDEDADESDGGGDDGDGGDDDGDVEMSAAEHTSTDDAVDTTDSETPTGVVQDAVHSARHDAASASDADLFSDASMGIPADAHGAVAEALALDPAAFEFPLGDDDPMSGADPLGNPLAGQLTPTQQRHGQPLLDDNLATLSDVFSDPTDGEPFEADADSPTP
ncbi:hypothetical protein HK105_202039 [Polyrhizophydium stewartii]|uniref:Uncharacterized protein n=1 Tax=Polyrhizophydium stewartii TaxID=2732419 RepID=A0ABR4NGI5_9FUNG